MITLTQLPCTARKLEAALHAYCDAQDAWDAEVFAQQCVIDYDNDLCRLGLKLTLTPVPSESAATKTTNPTNKE